MPKNALDNEKKSALKTMFIEQLKKVTCKEKSIEKRKFASDQKLFN